MIKIPCTHCGSTNTRAIDTEVLAVNSVKEISEGAPKWDNEAYMKGYCDNCGEEFAQVFDLKPRISEIRLAKAWWSTLDVPEGVVSDGYILQEYRKEVKSNLKSELIDIVIDTIESDINQSDKTAVDELLRFCPVDNLISYLPEELWKKFDSLKK